MIQIMALDQWNDISMTNEWSTNNSANIYFSQSCYNAYMDPMFLSSINVHWMQFEPPKPWEHYTLAIILFVIMVIGIIGNSLVIYTFYSFKNLRRPSKILHVNLAISDSIMLAAISVYVYNSFQCGPAFGYIGCKLYGFIGGLTGTTSIITLTVISINRYVAVVSPVTGKTYSSVTILCVIWLYSFLFAIMPALNIGLSKYVPEGFLTSCSFDYLDVGGPARVFILIYFIGAWLIPLITIIYCYTKVIKTFHAGGQIRSNQNREYIERKLADVVKKMIILWFLAWTPYSLVTLLGIAGKYEYLTPWISMLPALFCKLSACLNPYLYSMTGSGFKKEILRLLYEKFGIGEPMEAQPRVRFVSTPNNL